MRKRKLLSVLCRRQTCLSETAADMPGISAHKVIKRFLGIALVCLCFAAQAWGENFEQDGLKYTITTGSGGSTVTVDGLTVAASEATAIVIQPTVTNGGVGYPVTAIAADAFKDKTTITSVSIPTSIVTVGANAFAGCIGLTSVKVEWQAPSQAPEGIANAFGGLTLSGIKLIVPIFTASGYGDADFWKGFAIEEVKTLNVATRDYFFGPNETTKSANVIANVEWSSEVTTDNLWLTLGGTQSGTNTGGSLHITVADNTTVSDRSGTITISGEGFDPITINVTQKAASFSVANKQVGPDASSSDTDITVTSNIGWTATTTSEWLTIPTDNGNGTVYATANGDVLGQYFTVTFGANTTTAARTATITISAMVSATNFGENITVTQAAPYITLAAAALVGGTGTQDLAVEPDGLAATTVTVTSNIAWETTKGESDTWITLATPTGTGTGTETFTITVAPNTGLATRTGTITVKGTGAFTGVQKSITVTQTATPQINLSSTPALTDGTGTQELTVGPSGSSGAVTINVAANVAWAATKVESDDWITLSATPTGTGTGTETFTITVAANAGFSPRTGIITVSDTEDDVVVTKTITVKQAPTPQITLASEDFPSGAGGASQALSFGPTGSTGTIVTVTANIAWAAAVTYTVSAGDEWITATPTSNTGNVEGGETLTVTVGAYEGFSPRTGTITITGGGAEQTITVTQTAAPQIGLTSDALTEGTGTQILTAGPTGLAATTITVTANVAWAATKGASDTWITLSEPPAGTGASAGETFTITVAANATGSDREGTITVSSTASEVVLTKTITVKQAAAKIELAEDENDALSFGAFDLGAKNVALTANIAWTATVAPTDASAWLTTAASGSTGETLTVTVTAANTGAVARNATITINGTAADFTGVTETITVTQAAPITFGDGDLSYIATSLATVAVTGLADASATEIVIPATVTVEGATEAEDVTYAVTSIKASAFENSAITSVSIPASITSVGADAFKGCTGLTSVEVKWATPTVAPSDIAAAFDSDVSGIDLTVPFGTEDAYADADFWKYFGTVADVKTLDVSPITLNPGPTGLTATVITVTGNVAWTVAEDEDYDWITLSDPTAAMGSSDGETFTITVLPYTEKGEDRIGTITVSSTEEGVELTQTITVTQEAPYINVEAEDIEVGPTASTSIGIEITVTANIAWTAVVTEGTWLQIPTGTGGGNGSGAGVGTAETFIIAFEAFAGDVDPRTATITVSGTDAAFTDVKEEITVTQKEAYLTVEEDDIEVLASAGTIDVAVDANITWSAAITTGDWFTVSTGEGKLTIDFGAYDGDGEPREGEITVTAGDLEETIAVTQSAPYITVSSPLSLGSSAGTQTVTVTANIAWTATASSTGDWLTIPIDEDEDNGTGKGDGTFTVKFTANTAATTTSSRSATITVTGTEAGFTTVSATIAVTQEGRTVTPDPGPTDPEPETPSEPEVPPTPPAIAPTGVSLNQNSITLKTGDTQQLTATVTPSNADNKSVSWTSSNTAVATVSSSGVVTAVAAGTATITATTAVGGYKATCKVTVEERNVVVEAPKPEGNKGVIEVSLNLPADGSFSCTFTLTLPQGFVLDQSVTALDNDLKADYQLGITLQSGNTWQFDIRLKSSQDLRAATTYRNLVDVAYTIEESLPSGNHEVKLTNVELTMSDNTVIREDEIVVSVSTGSTTGIAKASEGVAIRSEAGRLYVTSPAAETVYIYSFNGKLLYTAKKAAGQAIFDAPSEKLLIVRGTSGWTRKLMK